MARSLVILVAAILVACTTATTPPPAESPERPMYSYTLTPPTDELRPGEARTLEWKATQNGQSAGAASQPARLCFGVIGAFASAADLKSFAQPVRTCPVSFAGVVFTSAVAEVDPFTKTTVTQDLRLPNDIAPGLYSFVQVIDWGGGNTMSAAGVIKVVAAP